jgi:hypothetical protein
MKKWTVIEAMGLILENDPEFFQKRAYSEKEFDTAAAVELAIRNGDEEYLARLMGKLYEDIALAKRINRLVCKVPKAFKKGTFGMSVRLYDGTFTLPNRLGGQGGLPATILRWTRLAEHALTRVRKHPLYKEI